jgi:OmpA-OmpF porin, OOP family
MRCEVESPKLFTSLRRAFGGHHLDMTTRHVDWCLSGIIRVILLWGGRIAMLQPKKWWIGAPVVLGLLYFAVDGRTPEIEKDLAERIGAKIADYDGAVDSPQIAVDGRDAVLSGVALDDARKEELLAQLRSAEGIRSVADATQTLAIVSPFTISIERGDGKIALKGYAPSKAAQAKLRAAAASLGGELSDSSGLAAGAPKEFDALVDFAVAQLARLGHGKATLADNRLALEGEAKTPSDYEGLFAAAKSAPAGVAVAALDISPPHVSPYVWSASNNIDTVTLTGSIPSSDLREKIAAKAAAVGSAGAVSDSTQIGAGVPAGDFEGAVNFALAELGKLKRGKAVITDSKVAIEGEGRENVAKTTIEADAAAHLPQGFEIARLDVEAGPVSPFVFTARRGDEGVTLSGFASDEAQREKIVAAAKRSFASAPIVDRLALAKGAPPGYADAAIVALRALARLEQGKLDVEGAKISLDGAAFHPRAVADIESKLVAAIPQNFRAETRLSAHTPGSNLSAEECQSSLSGLTSKRKIQFDANGAIEEESAPLLDALAAVVLRCQEQSIEVGGYLDLIGIAEVNRDASKRRAQSVVDYLVRAGADSSKLDAVGHGAEQPIAANDAEENRARNSRIEFLVKKSL